MTTLAELTETLGPSVIRVSVPAGRLDDGIRDVLILDRADPPDVRPGDLILGIGLSPEGDARELVKSLAGRGAVGLVVKSPLGEQGDLAEACGSADVALLTLPAGASWYQIVLLTNSVTSKNATRVEGAIPAGDLFAVADAAASLIDGPVTIEDRLSRVIAYSERQDEADAVRAETIVGRRVPARMIDVLERDGVFRRLSQESGPIYIEGIGDGILPRLAVAVRAGDEVLGSMWAALKDPPDDDRCRAFADAAKLAALHMLRDRAEAHVERRLQADLVTTILSGAVGSTEAAERLRLRGDGGFRVLAIASRTLQAEARDAEQLLDALAIQLSAYRLRAGAALINGIVYCILGTDEDLTASHERVLEFARDFATRAVSGIYVSPLVAIGGHAERLRDIPRSKAEADEALKVLRSGRVTEAVAAIEEVRMRALLHRVREIASEQREIFEGKVAILAASDRDQRTSYVETLRAYFDAFGDVAAAATRLHVHPNTLRYRIKKAQEVSGIDLDDPEERLALMVLVSVVLDAPAP